jgi:hypothetical protein
MAVSRSIARSPGPDLRDVRSLQFSRQSRTWAMIEAGSQGHLGGMRWKRAFVVVVLLGLSLLSSACQALKPRLAFPSAPSEACRPALTQPGSASSVPSSAWSVALEIDRPEGSAILFDAGGETLLCFVSRSADGSVGAVSTALGGQRTPGPALTLDLSLATLNAQVADVLSGRVPTGTTTVHVRTADGAEDLADVASGYYLAWLTVPAPPVEIDALDAAGHLLQRLADPIGSPVPG